MATLITTVGGTTSNSYASDAEFVAYLTDRANAPVDLLTNPLVRTNALLAAAHDLETLITWEPSRVGSRVSLVQALRFPAFLVRNRHDDGYYDDNIIPDFVKRGQMEQAIAYATVDPQAPATDAIESVRVDVVDIKFVAGSGATPGVVLADAAARELAFWVRSFDDGGRGDGPVPLILV